MKTFGIDVSKWQGNFDFDKAKDEGVKFAILRGACAGTKDPKFEQFYKDCKFYDIPVGVYHYSMATTVEAARKEAEFLYNNVLRGKRFEFPIYIDVEDKVQLALSKAVLTNIVKTWCEYLEAKKFYVGIYAGKYTFRDNLNDSELKKYTHWIPMWGSSCTYEDKTVLGMWQFGGETNVIRKNTVAGVVTDQNYCFKDFAAIVKAKKLNGYSNSSTTQTTVTSNSDANAAAFKPGDKVKLKTGAKYYDGTKIPPWVLSSVLYVRSISGNRIVVSTQKTGAVTGAVNKTYLVKA